MKLCNTCGGQFQWGLCDGKWVPLEPIGSHDDLRRTYVDEDGVLRADHRDRCRGESVNVTRLAKKIKPEEVAAEEPVRKRMAMAARVARGRG